MVMGTTTPLPLPPISLGTLLAVLVHSTDRVPHHHNRVRLLPCHAAQARSRRPAFLAL